MKHYNLVIAAMLSLTSFAAAQPHRPNIILIVADDLDNRSVAYMPNLKTLIAEQGVTFSNYFNNVPLCGPSRASILRGQFAHNTQIQTNQLPDGGFEKFRDLGHENSTVATWLQAAGYRTALFGKYLNGYPANQQQTYVPKGWDEWYGTMEGHFFNYDINENGKIVSYGNRPEDYETDVLARHATDFIKRNKAVPFFIYLAPFAPHSPHTPAPRHQNAFPGITAPRLPSFNESNVGDKPQWVRRLPLLTGNDVATIDLNYRERLQSLLAADDMIKSLIDTLAAIQELDDTYIFFTSDNGFHLGEHRIANGKNTAYDEAAHLPLIVRGPGVPKGKTVEHFVQNLDYAPTFAEFAGVRAPSFVDGRSFAPLLKDNPPPINTWRPGALIEHWGKETNDRTPTLQALRTADYLYVEYQTGERELYDVRNDPYQLRSLHASADPTLISQLAQQLDVLRKCAGGGCLTTAVEEKKQSELPPNFELRQNYPNPFSPLGRGTFSNPATTIHFSLPVSEHVTLKIFDLNGQEIKTLVQQNLPAGEHRVTFDAGGMASGVYFYRITTPTFSQTRKAILMQ